MDERSWLRAGLVALASVIVGATAWHLGWLPAWAGALLAAALGLSVNLLWNRAARRRAKSG